MIAAHDLIHAFRKREVAERIERIRDFVDRAQSAVVTALAPICVDKFRHAKNADENLGKLKAISYSWEKGTYVSAGGWPTLPGNAEPNSAVAQACAELLSNAAK